MINLTLLFIQLIFFALGVFVTVFANKIRSVLSISLGTVFGLYILGSLVVTKSTDAARYFFPFKYFDYTSIINKTGYDAPYLITGAAIVTAAIAATYYIYTKKDIHAVS
jgi:ABC-2 type transport system permease protein